MSEPQSTNFEPITADKRVMTDVPAEQLKLIEASLSGTLTYQGEDPMTGDTYWFLAEPMMAFVLRQEPRQVIVYSIGHDPPIGD